MSNLNYPIWLYPIRILVAEGKEIQTSLQRHGDDITKKKERLDEIIKALRILVRVMKEELDEKIEREEEEIRKLVKIINVKM